MRNGKHWRWMPWGDPDGVRHAFERRRDDQEEARCGMRGTDFEEDEHGANCLQCRYLLMSDQGEKHHGVGRRVFELARFKADSPRKADVKATRGGPKRRK